MRIVVIGGSGLIGSKLVTKLRARDYKVVAASPESGVDTLTGEGLEDVLEGASVVVDVTNSPSFEDTAVLKFFETSTNNLLTYEAAAGVRHHIALSVVSAGRLPESGYLRAKIIQEKLIQWWTIPYTIVRATQFYEFIKGMADAAAVANVVRVPPVQVQPMAADDVARALVTIAVSDPLNTTVEVAGPDRFRFDHFIRHGLGARGDPRQVVADPRARYFGAELGEYSLIPGEGARLGETHFEEWLSQSTRESTDAHPQLAAANSRKAG